MIASIRTAIIPALNTFCGVPVIESDQVGERPEGSHATYKFIATVKDVGQAEEKATGTVSNYKLQRIESFRVTLSLSAIDPTIDGSLSLAEKINEWFDFYGSDILSATGLVVIEKTGIQNRDVFLMDEYERRNGFDVILRVTKTIVKDSSFIEKIEINGNVIEKVEIN